MSELTSSNVGSLQAHLDAAFGLSPDKKSHEGLYWTSGCRQGYQWAQQDLQTKEFEMTKENVDLQGRLDAVLLELSVTKMQHQLDIEHSKKQAEKIAELEAVRELFEKAKKQKPAGWVSDSTFREMHGIHSHVQKQRTLHLVKSSFYRNPIYSLPIVEQKGE